MFFDSSSFLDTTSILSEISTCPDFLSFSLSKTLFICFKSIPIIFDTSDIYISEKSNDISITHFPNFLVFHLYYSPKSDIFLYTSMHSNISYIVPHTSFHHQISHHQVTIPGITLPGHFLILP